MPKVEFYFDYASPWAYLASELLERRLPGAEVIFKPVYLRGFEAFSKGLPYGSDKLRYLLHDAMRWSEHERVPIRFPSHFPVNGLYAVRGTLWALDTGVFPTYHTAMFRAAWREDRDVSQKSAVVEVAKEAGLDGAALAAALEDPAIKERLKSETAAAAARGIFGVPTFAIGDELFWGQDRMDFVARALQKKS